MSISGDIQTLLPGALVTLLVLDGTALGAGVLRFHGYTQLGSIWWQSNEYVPWPIESLNFQRTTDQQPTPKIAVGNIDGSITALCLNFADFIGATLTRKRTLGKFLDPRNFPATLITELVANGNFSTGTGWTLGSGVAIGGGTCNWTASSGAATNVLTAIAGTTYRILFDTLGITGGSVTPSFGGVAGTPVTANGTQNQQVITATGTGALTFTGAAFTGSIDNVSVMAYSNPTADPSQHFADEVWFVERKASEDSTQVQWELSCALDVDGRQLPGRQIIANLCGWLAIGGYRGPYCGYTGGAVALADDTPTTDITKDMCGGRVSSCKLRFPVPAQLPYGGYPAAGLLRV